MSEHTWTLEEQKAHRHLWVDALRSGKYKQAKEALKTTTGAMCCLGVLCELAGVEWEKSGVGRKILPVDATAHVATRQAMEFVGLRKPSGDFTNEIWGLTSLADLNDDGKRFKTIANIIESEPPGLFTDARATSEGK